MAMEPMLCAVACSGLSAEAYIIAIIIVLHFM